MAKEKPKILQLCPRLHTGGIERGTVDVAIALSQANFTPVVAAGPGKLSQELKAHSIKYIELPLYKKTPWGVIQNAAHLKKIIHEEQIDLVHARSRAPLWAAALALKNNTIPFVTSCHSVNSPGPWNLKNIYNRIVSRGDRVIAISQFIADYLINTHHTSPNKIELIYRGIDLTKLDPTQITNESKKQFMQQHNIPDDRPIIIFLARVTRLKGQDTLIHALNHLKPLNFHTLIVGRIDSPNFANEIKQLVKTYQLSEHVTFIDEPFDLATAYSIADIAVSASRKPEAFGRVIAEAQSMGAITIASNLGGTGEVILDQQTGFLMPPEDPTKLAQLIKQILDFSPEKRAKIKQAARQRVEQHFNKTVMLEKTLEVYRQLLLKTKKQPLA